MSAMARKWIIIICTKYLMFPLFSLAHKQMRHHQCYCTYNNTEVVSHSGAGAGSGTRLCLRAAGSEPPQGPDHHGTNTQTTAAESRSTHLYAQACAQPHICSHQGHADLVCGKR